MHDRAPLNVIQLTAPGRGAIATLRVEGAGAVEAVANQLHRCGGGGMASLLADRPVLARFGGPDGQEVVVRLRSPQAIDLHCHGGHAAVSLIEQALAASGCRIASWPIWAAEHHPDPITAAAHIALAEAQTERTAAILLDQYSGALRAAIDEVRARLADGAVAAAEGLLGVLLARAAIGIHLTKPWRVVLAGRPNVGKSSLINALVGYQRAIVHATPGTTRDAVTATTAVEGWPIELCDTAGLRDSGDPLEQAGVALARLRSSTADLVVLVFDASHAWSEDDRVLFESHSEALLVHNKSDLATGTDQRPAGLSTCALGGEGVDLLVHRIAARLVPQPPPPGAAVPFTAGQIEQIETALAALAAGRVEDAERALGTHTL
jgi:tRNA modification GTPase